MDVFIPSYLHLDPSENNRFDTFDLDGDGIRQIGNQLDGSQEVIDEELADCLAALLDCLAANAELQAALDTCELNVSVPSPVYDVDPTILVGATASQLFTLIYYQDRDFIECSNHMELLVARHATEIKWAWRNTWIGNNVGNGSVNSSLTYPTRIPNTSNSFPDPDVYLAAKIIFRGGRDGGIETRSGTIPMTGYNRITWNGLEFAMFDAPFANGTVV